MFTWEAKFPWDLGLWATWLYPWGLYTAIPNKTVGDWADRHPFELGVAAATLSLWLHGFCLQDGGLEAPGSVCAMVDRAFKCAGVSLLGWYQDVEPLREVSQGHSGHTQRVDSVTVEGGMGGGDRC